MKTFVWALVGSALVGAILFAAAWGVMTIHDWRTHPGGDMVAPEKYETPKSGNLDWPCPPGRTDCKG